MKKDQNGITLIALIVTIIVLLILAAVSLSLVAGSDGIINKAVKAIDETKKAQIVEEIELAVAKLKADYYYDKYNSTPTISGSFKSYLKGKLEETGGVKTASGTLELQEDEETLIYKNTKTIETTEGEFDKDTGVITILERTIGIAETTGGGSGTPVLEAITDATHYGDYFELGTSLLDRENVKLEGNETMLADWRIFSRDDTGVWLILADFLPVGGDEINSLITGTDENQIGLVTFTTESVLWRFKHNE